MLRKLRIQNFKGWEDTGVIEMAPITLFFGQNSSGKSSIGQFLMMLKQTAEFADRKAVLYPGGKNSPVQLGSYKEMVLHRDPNLKITFDYSWDTDKKVVIEDSLSNETYTGSTLIFKASLGLANNEQATLAVENLKYGLKSDDGDILAITMERNLGPKTGYKIDAEGYHLKRNTGRVWDLGAPVHFYGFPDEVVAYYQNADFVKGLNLRHEKLFQAISYLGPLRSKADRLYSWGGTNPESVGYAGEYTVEAILAAQNRRISLGKRQRRMAFQGIIARELKEMGLIESFTVNSISEKHQEYEVKVAIRGTSDLVDLPDVGFGISQVLPVLTQIFYAPPGSIIIMEQPEIHLHPSAQAALADVMLDAINSREYGADRNIQLIIETHSEHFLRRLQRRIAEGKIPQDMVSAYFANTAGASPTLESLRIDPYGNILNWPKNFFGDDMGDITSQAVAAMERRLGENAGGSE